jgi:hypothetical protein
VTIPKHIPTLDTMSACSVKLGDVLLGFLPTLLSIGIVASLASSHDSPFESRVTAFATGSVLSAAYGAANAFLPDTTINITRISDAGSDIWLTDLYEYAPIVDTVVVAYAAAQLVGAVASSSPAWTVLGLGSAAVHMVGLAIGDYTDAAVVVLGLMVSGLLNNLGNSLAAVTDFLPERFQVRKAFAHVLLALGLFVGTLIYDDESFEDIISDGTVVAAIIVIVIFGLLELADLSLDVARIAVAAALITSFVIGAFATEQLTEVKSAPLTCTGNKIVVAAEVIRSGDDDGMVTPYVLLISAATLTGATLAMSATEYLPGQYDGVTDAYRGGTRAKNDENDEEGNIGKKTAKIVLKADSKCIP